MEKIRETLYECNERCIRRIEDNTGNKYIFKGWKDNAQGESYKKNIFEEYEYLKEIVLDIVLKPIKIYEDENKEGILYENFNGNLLYNLLDGRSMDIVKFLEVALIIVNGLIELQRNEIIHGNLNPLNIFIDYENKSVKFLGDLYKNGSKNIDEIIIFEKYLHKNYISPEQTEKTYERVSFSSNYYSLGIIFYEMISGKVPFQSKSMDKLIYCHLAKKPRALNSLGLNIPDTICKIIDKLLSKNHEKRYKSAYGIKLDLEYCLNEYKKYNFIHEVDIPIYDTSPQVFISKRFYGRKKELRLLEERLNESQNGFMNYVCISGELGSGKTTLINYFIDNIRDENILLVNLEGNELSLSDISIQLLNELMTYILVDERIDLSNLKERLKCFIQGNENVVFNVCPYFKNLYEKNSQYKAFKGEINESLILDISNELIKIIDLYVKNVIIRLNGINMENEDFLNIFEYLSGKYIFKNTLVIVECINKAISVEVREKLNNLIENKLNVKNTILHLSNLRIEDISNHLKDTFSITKEEAIKLSYLVFNKTQGNPFLIEQLILRTIKENKIYFDKSIWKWMFNLTEKDKYNRNVKEYIEYVIDNLGNNRLKILLLLNAAKQGLDFYELKDLSGFTSAELTSIIRELKYSNIVYEYFKKISTDYGLFENRKVYRISNDLIVGKINTMATPDIVDRIIKKKLSDIENRDRNPEFNECKWIIETIKNNDYKLSDAEKITLVRMYTYLGESALSTESYIEAESMLLKAYDVYNDELKELDYDLYFKLNKYRAILMSMKGDIKASENIYQKLINKSDLNTSLIVYTTKMFFNLNNLQYKEACETSKEGLALILTNNQSKKLNKIDYYKQGIFFNDKVVENIHKIKEEIFSGFLVKSVIAAIYCDRDYLKFLMVVATNAYGYYDKNKKNVIATLLSKKVFIDKSTADVIYDEVINKRKKSQDIYDVFGLLMMRNKSLKQLSIYHRCLIDNASEKGITQQIFYYKNLTIVELFKGNNINDVKKIMNEYQNNVIKDGNEKLLYEYRFIENFVQFNLDINYEFIKNSECINKKINELINVLMYMMRFFFKKYHDLIPSILEEDTFLKKSSFPAEPQYYFYTTLCLADYYYENKDKAVKILIKKRMKIMKKYGELCDENYQSQYLILKAIYYCMNLDVKKAIDTIELAINKSKRDGNNLVCAIANEVAAKICVVNDFSKLSSVYVADSIKYYNVWGSKRKSKKMYEDYRDITYNAEEESNNKIQDYSDEVSNLNNLIDITNSISSEIDIDKLLYKVLNVILKNTSAERALILLENKLQLKIEAEGDRDRISLNKKSFSNYDKLSRAIINYVYKTKESIIFDKEHSDTTFMLDKYINSNLVEAIACYPIIVEDMHIGVIYLESYSDPKAFRNYQINLLDYIVKQSGIAINNSKVHRELKELNNELKYISEDKTKKLELYIEKLKLQIKEREIVEGKLRKSKDKYQVFFESIPELVYIYDFSKGSIIESNSAFKSMLGVFDTLGEDSRRKFYTTDGEQLDFDYIFGEILMGRVVEDIVVSVERANQTIIVLNQKYLPIYENRIVNKMVCISKDITELMEVEAIKKREQEKSELLKKTIEYDKLKTEFFANLSHEFKTPLNVILGSVQLLNKISENNTDNNPKVITYLSVMKQNCYRLLRLVNNIIDITKIEDGYLKLSLKEYDIVKIVEDITMSVVQYAENKGINLIFDTELEEKTILCDEEKLERIVLNLLSNALKFTGRDGNILVYIYDKGDKISISIKDSGDGISEEQQQGIFNRFVQADKSLSRKHEGSGIGLSLVKMLVELHGGSIELRSKLGEGSEFIITLPCQIEDIGENEIELDELLEFDKEEKLVEKISVEFSDIYF